MTDGQWAEVGRRTDALAHELTEAGWEVIVVFDRPHDRVFVTIRPPGGQPSWPTNND